MLIASRKYQCSYEVQGLALFGFSTFSDSSNTFISQSLPNMPYAFLAIYSNHIL